jgi:hypothetical protein
MVCLVVMMYVNWGVWKHKIPLTIDRFQAYC